MRRAGLDPETVTVGAAELAMQRDVGEWLPMAMADLYTLVLSFGCKRPPTATDTLRRWGLKRDADAIDEAGEARREAAEDMALRRFFGASARQ